MKAFESIVALGGLSSSDGKTLISDGLHTCLNLRPTGGGLVRFKKPVLVSDKVRYPFPQKWEGNKFAFTVTPETVFVSSSETFRNTGKFFEFFDFHNFVLGISEDNVLYRNVAERSFSYGMCNFIPTGVSALNYSGQLIVGGVTNGWNGLPPSAICWSRIGIADFTLDSSNVAGYAILQKVNRVFKLLLFGGVIFVYTDTGMFKCKPSGLAFGFVRVNSIAAVHKDAIAGSNSRQIFFATDGYLYQVTSDEVKKLGYSWLADKLNVLKMRIICNEATQDFYITDGNRTFVLCDFGMFQTTIVPNCFYNDSLIGSMTCVGVDGKDLLGFETGWLSFSRLGLKTLESFDLLISPVPSDYSLLCKTEVLGSSVYSKICTLGDNLSTTPVITGNRFKISYFAPYASTDILEIAGLKTRVKYTDRRNYRAGGGNFETAQ